MPTRKRRLTFLLAALICCVHPCAAQEKCQLERAIAPNYGGVFTSSLGMLELSIRKEEFKGVEELALRFIGGRAHRIDVSFRAPARGAKALGPAEAWAGAFHTWASEAGFHPPES